MKTIYHEGDTYNVWSEGISREGKTLCHLASTTRFRSQKNGKIPAQICDWVDSSKLEEKAA